MAICEWGITGIVDERHLSSSILWFSIVTNSLPYEWGKGGSNGCYGMG